MTKLTPHFQLAEFVRSGKAKALGIDNTPNQRVIANLKRLARELEKVRALTGKPLRILSGYRCPALNQAVGGVAASFHVDGCAADFDPPPGMTHDALQHAIAAAADIRFDLVLEERAGDGAHWLHFQVTRKAKDTPRRKVLDATLAKQGAKITGFAPG